MEKLIITAAICGAEVTKKHNPAVPYTVEEMVREAKSAFEAGAAAGYENICVVDGTSAATGTGILAELAFRLLNAGMSAEEIADALEKEKKKIVVVALIEVHRRQPPHLGGAFAGGSLHNGGQRDRNTPRPRRRCGSVFQESI